jgi:hypothetical protein
MSKKRFDCGCIVGYNRQNGMVTSFIPCDGHKNLRPSMISEAENALQSWESRRGRADERYDA